MCSKNEDFTDLCRKDYIYGENHHINIVSYTLFRAKNNLSYRRIEKMLEYSTFELLHMSLGDFPMYSCCSRILGNIHDCTNV